MWYKNLEHKSISVKKKKKPTKPAETTRAKKHGQY